MVCAQIAKMEHGRDHAREPVHRVGDRAATACNPFPCDPDRDRLPHIAASGDDGCDGAISS